MVNDSKMRGRKFFLATFSLMAGTLALFTGHLVEGTWLGLVGTVLAVYGVANVFDKKSGGAG